MKLYNIMLAAVLFCAAYPAGAQAFEKVRVPTDFSENGNQVFLEMVVFKPFYAQDGPLPVMVFNHGSTGMGNDPGRFAHVYYDKNIARFFNSRGWVTVFPQRRGRGGSDGLYDEGFTKSHTRYSISPARSLKGLERAMDDIDQVVAYLREDPSIDDGKMLIGGVSRGGILSVAYAGSRPGVFIGTVNFVGGWIGKFPGSGFYRVFYDYMEKINTVSFRNAAGSGVPTIWLYGENDSFYSIDHSRKNFDAFIEAGGEGTFHQYFLGKGVNGHLLSMYPRFWNDDLAVFMKQF